LAVAEKEKGTMTLEKGQEKSTPESEVKTPESVSRVSPEEEEQPIYTQKQSEALIHAAKSEAGRQVKAIETERDNLKSQIATKESELGDIQSERDSLQQQIEDLSSDDPKKFDLIKRDKNLRDREREVNGKISTLDDREQKLSEREKKVSGFELEVLIESVADEYEDGDSAKLKKALSVFENPTEEQARNIADIIFTNKTEGAEEKPKTIKPDSGKTRGGSTYFTREQIADRNFWEANKDAILEAQKEGRIRE